VGVATQLTLYHYINVDSEISINNTTVCKIKHVFQVEVCVLVITHANSSLVGTVLYSILLS